MRIQDVMSHPAVTCPKDVALDSAARLMWEFDCGVVLVVDDAGRLAGVVTDRDVCVAAYVHRKPLHLIPIARAMAKRAIAAHADDDIANAEHLMRDNRVRRLPVIDDEGHPVGLLSIDDLARLADEQRRTDMDRELVETLAAFGRRMDGATGPPHPLVPVTTRHT